MDKEGTIIIALGGALIIPDILDRDFLKDFKDLVLSHVKQGKKFVIITGGGKICRTYQDAAKELTNTSTEDLDWIGIASLKLNAELLRIMFKDNAHEQVIEDLSMPFSLEKPIVIGSAYKPGRSTDYDAVLAAKSIGAKKIINLSNIDYVYDSDPKVNPNAKKIEKISWADYENIIPKKWTSGLNSPFDPIASKLAEREGITVMIMNGKPIDNFAACLNKEKFKGTVIS